MPGEHELHVDDRLCFAIDLLAALKLRAAPELHLTLELLFAFVLTDNPLLLCYVDRSERDVVVPWLNFIGALDLTSIELVSCRICEDELPLCRRQLNTAIGSR